jgi:uncharacterized lipoprotein YmbA
MRALAVAALVGLSGCFLPDPPAAPRYFTPAAPDEATERVPVAVRLGVVRSPLHLREAMTWRRSDVEFGFYEQRRWTELPATYVERALSRELLPAGAPLPTSPDAPVVSAELRAFEEVLAPVHEARVALAVELADARCVRLRRTFAASRPLDGDDPAAVARGVGEALDEVVRSTADAIRDALARPGRCGA